MKSFLAEGGPTVLPHTRELNYVSFAVVVVCIVVSCFVPRTPRVDRLARFESLIGIPLFF